LVYDSVEDIIEAIEKCIKSGIPAHRSTQIEKYKDLIESINPNEKLTPEELQKHMESLGFLEKDATVYEIKDEIKKIKAQIYDLQTETKTCTSQTKSEIINSHDEAEMKNSPKELNSKLAVIRGRTWFEAIVGKDYEGKSKINSVLCEDIILNSEKARVIAVVPDENTYYPRSKRGEIGLEQGFEVARCIREAINEDEGKTPRPIIAVVDVPSQAYGYKEELLGIFLACASSVDAYASARLAGHPVITFIVGNAISGAFLAHGLQGSYMISLDDDTITVHAMSKKSAARITKRSISDMEKSAEAVPAIAYDIHSFNCLGALNSLLKVSNHDVPSKEDIDKIKDEIAKGISVSRENGNTLKYRLETDNARIYRKLSTEVRQRLKELW